MTAAPFQCVACLCFLASYKLIISVQGTINGTGGFVSKPTDNAKLWCVSDALPKPRKIIWYKDGKELHKSKDHYDIQHNTESLEVIKVGEEDVGKYSCKDSGTDETAEVILNAGAWSEDGAEVEVKEGESIIIDCHAWGYPAPTVKWYFNDDHHEIKADGKRITVEDKATKQKSIVLKNGRLKIDGATRSDAGSYKCQASNARGSHDYSHDAKTSVRVRENLEALWPAIGIALELGVIGGGIGYYEYNKNKKNKAEKHSDQEFKERNNVEVRRHEELQIRDQLK